MITPPLETTPPAIVRYTRDHWRGYIAACYPKHTGALTVKLAPGASFVVYGLFQSASTFTPVADTLAQAQDDGSLLITSPDAPRAIGVVCMAVSDAAAVR